jgi:hypothetical protein
MHLLKVLAEVISEVLNQSFHVIGDGSHGMSSLQIPRVTWLLGGVGGYGGGGAAARVWWHGDRRRHRERKRGGGGNRER